MNEEFQQQAEIHFCKGILYCSYVMDRMLAGSSSYIHSLEEKTNNTVLSQYAERKVISRDDVVYVDGRPDSSIVLHSVCIYIFSGTCLYFFSSFILIKVFPNGYCGVCVADYLIPRYIGKDWIEQETQSLDNPWVVQIHTLSYYCTVIYKYTLSRHCIVEYKYACISV